MSEANSNNNQVVTGASAGADGATVAVGFRWTTSAIVAGLYTAGFIIPFTPFVAVVWAYLNRGKAEAWEESVIQYEIRTFWLSVVYTLVVSVLSMISLGILSLLYFAIAIWFIIRLVKMWIACKEQQPIGTPTTWLW